MAGSSSRESCWSGGGGPWRNVALLLVAILSPVLLFALAPQALQASSRDVFRGDRGREGQAVAPADRSQVHLPLLVRPPVGSLPAPDPQPSPAPSTASFAEPVLIGAMFAPVEISTYCSQMPEYGVRALTLTIPWNAVEPRQDILRWEETDRIISQARSCGAAIGVHVLSKSSWATQSPPESTRHKDPSMPPLSQDDYYDFVFELASRYRGQIRRYSIENEAAVPQNWGSTPEAYIELLRTAYAAIHAADPDAIVSPDGMSSTNLGLLVTFEMLDQGRDREAVDFFNRYYANFAGVAALSGSFPVTSAGQLRMLRNHPLAHLPVAWIDALAANHQSYDAFQIHYYAPPELLPTVIHWLESKLQSEGSTGKPIEIWELGYGWSRPEPLDLTDQAETIFKLVGTAVGHGSNFLVVWRFTDEVEQLGTGVTGLVTAQGPRPAATAFRIAAEKLNGTTAAAPLNLGEEVFAYRFERDTGQLYLLWRTVPGTSQVALPVDLPTVKVTDVSGVTMTANPSTLVVGRSPIVVEPE